jgi:hypothetical protein
MEPGGIFAKIHGPCPVPQMLKYDGVNGGRGAGRACWTIMNSTSQKSSFICRNNRLSCFQCRFYQRVLAEEEKSTIKEIKTFDSPFNDIPTKV